MVTNRKKQSVTIFHNLSRAVALGDKHITPGKPQRGFTLTVSRGPALRGFTLIEILVVITLIVILASMGFVVVPRVQEQARDAKRISDLNNLSSAIENFYADQRRLPGIGGTTHYSFTVFGVNFQNCDGSGWIPENICSYINVLPVDPQNSLDFRYRYLPSSTTYEIDAPMEALTSEAANDGGNDNCGGGDECRYEVGTGLTLL